MDRACAGDETRQWALGLGFIQFALIVECLQ
jgi:hypothetical protein